ncbi:MAG: DUF1702 family protein [Xenococcaceae cyanobacterium]
MISTWGFMRRFVFGLSLEKLDILWSSFPGGETDARQRLRQISYTFVHGYNTTLEMGLSPVLVSTLHAVDPELRGFAFEGVGMGLALLDYLTPWNQYRLQEFIKGAGANYSELLHVGAGFAIAVLGRDIESSLAKMNPMQRWFAIDGLGFYYGMFHWQRSVRKQLVPKRLTGYARRAFDQGLGRCIWFGLSGDVKSISQTLATFSTSRQPDLWSGIGLACTYAGGLGAEEMAKVKAAAGSYQPHLAQGAAIAAQCRSTAGNVSEHTALACSVLCGMSFEAVTELTHTSMADLPISAQESTQEPEPSYEIWRQRTQSHWATVAVPS